MASVAKLHILPSLALKLQSYNKNKFRSGTCSGSQTGGTQPRGAEQESRPGWTSPRSILPASRDSWPGRSSGGSREEGPASSGWHRQVPGLRSGSGATHGRQGWGTRGARDTGDRRQRVRIGAFCRPSLVPRARLAPCPLGRSCHRPIRGRGAAQSGVLGGRSWAGGSRQALQLWQGRPCPGPARPGGVPVPPEPRASPAGSEDAPSCRPRSLRKVPGLETGSTRVQRGPSCRPSGRGLASNEARVARTPPARGAPQNQHCAPAAKGAVTEAGVALWGAL